MKSKTLLWIIVVFIAGWLLRGEFYAGKSIDTPRQVTPRADFSNPEQGTIALFEHSRDSVTYIRTLVRQRQSFFSPAKLVEAGAGSGWIWDQAGHIVTNYHVIRGASAALITLSDNKTYRAALIGASEDKDIAVLKISAPKDQLTPLPIGQSNDLKVGQSVFAIGNPFGLDFTLTTGVISALNRSLPGARNRPLRELIQTDAAINPGNSGGPLLDSAGRIIGMNTAIYSKTGQSAGIGFAVPVDIINHVVPQLIKYGKIIRPGLGVSVAAVSVSKRLNLPGVLIVDIARGSGSERAGLRPTSESKDGNIILGDNIISINNFPVKTPDDLLSALEYFEPGQQVTVTIDRGGQKQQVKVILDSTN